MFDSALDSLWRFLWQYQVLHWNMLEAYVAGFSFALWIIIYRLLDRLPIMNKYKFSTKIVEFSSFDSNSWVPLFLYLGSIHIYHLFITKPPIQLESPTILRLVIELFTGIVLYDFIFFWIHYAMHYFPSSNFCHHHNLHHQHTNLCASVVQQHSLIDATFQVLVNIFVQNFSFFSSRKHLLSRLIHNILITYLLTEIHAGYDGPWCVHRLFPGVVGGAAAHEIHHKYGSSNYQQFFIYLDQLMGTHQALTIPSPRYTSPDKKLEDHLIK
jgi:sterol desaturase/sphingolipid hydroxylase (fatty acid hydroxylase superfamily)